MSNPPFVDFSLSRAVALDQDRHVLHTHRQVLSSAALIGRQRERRYEMPLSSTLETPEHELDDDDWDDDEEFGTDGEELELDEFDDIDEQDDDEEI
jgi:hypothetical protein